MTTAELIILILLLIVILIIMTEKSWKMNKKKWHRAGNLNSIRNKRLLTFLRHVEKDHPV